jgi:hypothetical protein
MIVVVRVTSNTAITAYKTSHAFQTAEKIQRPLEVVNIKGIAM